MIKGINKVKSQLLCAGHITEVAVVVDKVIVVAIVLLMQ